MNQAIRSAAGRQSEPAQRFYLPELDVLRFFAFFAVFVSHVPPYGPIFYDTHGALGRLGAGGAFGVDLFFTLSGYLLTSLLLREREETGDIDLKAFYVRRILKSGRSTTFRWHGLSLTLDPATLHRGAAIPRQSFPAYAAKVLLLHGDFSYSTSISLVLSDQSAFFMTQLWSISVEEQFYLFWPWFARYVPRRRIVVVPIVMIAVSCIGRLLSPLDPVASSLDQYLHAS